MLAQVCNHQPLRARTSRSQQCGLRGLRIGFRRIGLPPCASTRLSPSAAGVARASPDDEGGLEDDVAFGGPSLVEPFRDCLDSEFGDVGRVLAHGGEVDEGQLPRSIPRLDKDGLVREC